MEQFHPLVREWFLSKFSAPSKVQAIGWPAIAKGQHTLISAPTGSGKTLAAFLICIDRLLQTALAGKLPETAQVVYVSPLKALSNDIHKNLSIPLDEIAALAAQRGTPLPPIRVAVRTGDTPPSERQSTARNPPHIWITTPESLFILLTSLSGRRGLMGVHTLILDEIHALVENKRGSHVALSMERLSALAARPITRIGLSATQEPIEEVARFLVGQSNIDQRGRPLCTILKTGHRRELDLRVEVPNDELGSIAGQSVWEDTVSSIARVAQEHRTTLVFVNTRRLVERISHQLTKKLDKESVVTHHGSLSRQTRFLAEERLRKGEVKVCVATASLELGIDIGSVDVVCQIGSPRSIGVLLQRVGRSGHWLGGIPKGRLYPLTRDELIECAALLHALRQGQLDQLHIPPWPLDILSQQIIAACASEAWAEEELFGAVRKAYPYRDLPRAAFGELITMLSDGIATPWGRRSALLHRDKIHSTIRGRRGARLAALTSGGAIPDTADYRVVEDPSGNPVGSVNEDFAIESLAGDVFLLGNTSWRIRRIEKGCVRVEDAKGQAPTIPFWLGEAPSRTHELSLAVSQIREELDRLLECRDEGLRWLQDQVGLSMPAALQVFEYMAEGKRVLGAVPTATRVIAERFFDESGGMQLVLHAPFGGRINRAWGLALRKRFCRNFDFELQAAATDDGINLSLGPQHSFPLKDIFQFLKAQGLEQVLVQAVLPSPIFTTRWRWTLTRSLALLRFSGGKRVPPQLQRMRSDDLLTAVFPAQTQCQDNRGGGDISIPDHPLVFETLRDCLHEALDVDGLHQVFRAMERGDIQLLARDTPTPSAFSHQILNAMPYAFLDDAPLEERRARAVILRRALPQDANSLGRLDPRAIESAAEDAWPSIRDPEELHDALLGWILFPETEKSRLASQCDAWFDSLVEQGRAFRLNRGQRVYWVPEENRELATNLPFRKGRTPAGPSPMRAAGENDPLPVVRGWVEVSGPLTSSGLSKLLGFEEQIVHRSFLRLEAEGLLLRGSFTGNSDREEFCDRRILARIHRATLSRLRREIQPVSASTFLRFLFSWQHLTSATRVEGEAGVREIVEQLQGFETAAAAWEAELLKPRILNYDPVYLDHLCLGGAIVWGRWNHRSTSSEIPTRRPGLSRSAVLGLALREDLSWILGEVPDEKDEFSDASKNVLEFLERRGASFFNDICAGTRYLPSQVEEALWQLVAGGLVTADAFASVRSLIDGQSRRRMHATGRARRSMPTRQGRWSLLHSSPRQPPPADPVELELQQLLKRYGVLFREMVIRESSAPPWRELLWALRRAEARGEVRGGRFIDGFAGEQFALPEAVDRLRALRRKETDGHFVRVSACDPLNLVGILTPGPRIPAVSGNRVVYRDGVPVAALEGGETQILAGIESHELHVLDRLLDERPESAFDPERAAFPRQ